MAYWTPNGPFRNIATYEWEGQIRDHSVAREGRSIVDRFGGITAATRQEPARCSSSYERPRGWTSINRLGWQHAHTENSRDQRQDLIN